MSETKKSSFWKVERSWGNRHATIEDFVRNVPAVISLTILSAFIGSSLSGADITISAGQIVGLIFLLCLFYALTEAFWDARLCRDYLKGGIALFFLVTMCILPAHLVTGISWINGPVFSGVLGGWLISLVSFSLYLPDRCVEESKVEKS